jgi:hypothetical protein
VAVVVVVIIFFLKNDNFFPLKTGI